MKIPEILLIESEHKPGNLVKILSIFAGAGLAVEHLSQVRREQGRTTWEITLEMDAEADRSVFEAINNLAGIKLLGRSDRVFDRHIGGKIETVSRSSIGSLQVLRDIYTPGVARVCLRIQKDPSQAALYTNRNRTVAIVTNGTAVLGLGNIGPLAGLPVMEGKAALFSTLGGISGVPLLIDSTDSDEIVNIIKKTAISFGAVQLEDIAAPECFEIEERLIKELDIPVLHDDQHGTAVVVVAAIMNAAKQVKRDLKKSVIGQIGLGAAGIGIVRLLKHAGYKKVLGSDLNEDALKRFASFGGEPIAFEELMKTADIVVATTGVRGLIKPEMIRKGQIILALSNPDPEIEPVDALAQGAAFAADGKGINNVLGFPGLFRGALDAKAKHFTMKMLMAASQAIADLAEPHDLVPEPLHPEVHLAVAKAVSEAV